MKHDSLRKLIAILCGGLLGAFVALELKRRFGFEWYCLPVGTIFGGLTGWIGCDLSGLVNTSSHLANTDREQLKAFRKQMVLLEVYTFILGVITFSFLVCIDTRTFTAPIIALTVLVGSAFFTAVFVLIVTSVAFFSSNDWQTRFATLDEVNGFFLYLIVRWVNPIALIYRILFSLPHHLVYHVMPILWRFVKTVFMKTHSLGRLTCLVYAVVGTATGYYLGSAIAGGVSGCVVWFLIDKIVQHVTPIQNTPV